MFDILIQQGERFLFLVHLNRIVCLHEALFAGEFLFDILQDLHGVALFFDPEQDRRIVQVVSSDLDIS